VVGMDNLDHDVKEDEYDEGEHRAMSLEGAKEINEDCDHDEEPPFCRKCGAMSLEGAKEINEECDHDEEPPFCRKCMAIWMEETRLGLDSNSDGKPIEYYLNENIERWFWDRRENKET
jgi:hypothetical protein